MFGKSLDVIRIMEVQSGDLRSQSQTTVSLFLKNHATYKHRPCNDKDFSACILSVSPVSVY